MSQPTAGSNGGEGGEGGQGGGHGWQDLSFNYVLIVDDSDEVVADGTPGVDICGVRAQCHGRTLTPIYVDFYPGDGSICGYDWAVGEPNCSVDRADADVVLSYGGCSIDSDPSNYVSLGVGGLLAVEFEEDLQGCIIEILEASGDVQRDEFATVSVCADEDGRDCILDEYNDVDLGWVEEGDNPARIDVPSF